jgi:hypothetical protein
MHSLSDPSIAALHAYWSRQRGESPAPRRSAIAPADIAPLLGDVFILDASQPASAPFRLAGTRLCTAFGRELRDEDFLDLWTGGDRRHAAAALAAVTVEAAALAVQLVAGSERGRSVAGEMVLLPLSQSGRAIDRVLGLFAPSGRPTWLGLHPLREFAFVATHRLHSGPAPASAIRPEIAATAADAPATDHPAEAAEARSRPRLVVLEGGRR